MKYKYCPKCKTEYENWVTICANCKVDLVDILPTEEISESQDFGKGKPLIIKMISLLPLLPFFFFLYFFIDGLFSPYKTPGIPYLLPQVFISGILGAFVAWGIYNLKNWARAVTILFYLCVNSLAVLFVWGMQGPKKSPAPLIEFVPLMLPSVVMAFLLFVPLTDKYFRKRR